MIGKSIRLFLAEGTPHGLISAEIVNWTGRVLVVARADLDKLAQRDEARRPGVYLLAGADPDSPTRERVYVGESENVLKRLVQHNRLDEKDFWTKTALILSKDENLTKSHIRFLESRIVKETRLAGRAILDNGTEPDVSPLPESDVADMDYFLSQVRILLPVLGFNLMQRLVQPETGNVTIDDERPTEFVMSASGLNASMRIVGDEFVISQGSRARKAGLASWTSYKGLREQLVQEGVLVDKGDADNYVFTRDFAFPSPSAAAAVVNAGNINGRTAWKHKDTGRTYKDWQEARLEAAGVGKSDEQID